MTTEEEFDFDDTEDIEGTADDYIYDADPKLIELIDGYKSIIANLGLFNPRPPAKAPPALEKVNIAELESRHLGRLLAQWTSYYAFALTKQAEVKAMYTASENTYKRVRSELRTGYRLEGHSEASLNDILEEDPRYISINEQLLHLKSLKSLLDSYVSSYKEIISSISRNITIRSDEQKALEREANVALKKGASTSRTHSQRRTLGERK